jgi:septal ring factor EnvC (AmiA/AmiB activator)
MRRSLLALALALVIAGIALAGSSDRFAYIYKRGDGDTTMRINGSIESFQRMAKRWSGEYIWVNRNGKEWLIRDAAVLASAREVFKEMEALEPAVQAAEERLRPIEENAEALEDRIERFEDDESREAEMREAERQLRAIEDQLRTAETAVERLDDEMERREEIAEAKFEKLVIRAIEARKAQRVD